MSENASDFKPDKAILKGAKQFDNLQLVLVRTTEDKLRNYVTQFRESIITQYAWTVPLGLCVSFLATLLTTSFTEKYGRPASFWEAIFVLAFIGTAIWAICLGIKAFRYRKECRVDHLIQTIKNDFPES